jgi:hypothetical protein
MGSVRQSMQNGESMTQAITRVTGGTIDGVTVPGIMKTTKKKAGALVSTAMSAVTNEAALASYKANSDVIKAVTQLSTLDNRTSDVCIAYSGQTWDLNTLRPIPPSTLPFNSGPPRHFNCRSRLRPVTKSFKELGLDKEEIPKTTRASMDGQVPADITFSDWLKTKPTSFADDLLGPKRAQLWRDDKITLTQLVDMRGNPMTLSQIEQSLGLKAKPKYNPATGRTTGTPKPKQKTVDSFLENDDGTFVQITQAEYDEIRGHAKRLVAAADEADEATTAAIKQIAKDIDAKFPDAEIDDVLTKEGSLHYRKKDLDSTSRKIQTYARDRNISYTEAADQISDSLRYTYVMEADDYAAGVMQAMEEFAERGYKNGKFDVAWVKRPDYKGINVNLITPEGVKMELQFHTARSFDVKQNINHALYEKFRKLSKAQQKGPKGQAIMDEMLANAKAIPVPQYMDELADLAKIYDRPDVARQAKILKEAAERKAAREARIRAARSADPEDQITYTGRPAATKGAARQFLKNNKFSDKFIREQMDDTLALMENWNPEIARNLLKQAQAKRAAIEAAKGKLDDAVAALPDEIPVFKTSAEAEEWTRKWLINADNNPVAQRMAEKGPRWKKRWDTKIRGYVKETFDDLLAWGNYNKEHYRTIAEVTIMMSKRFNMKVPNFMGVKRRHPIHRYKASKELAAVEMETDSLLLPTTLTNKAKVLSRANRQDNMSFGWTIQKENQLKQMLTDARLLKEQGVDYADELIAALEHAMRKKDFPWSATSLKGAEFAGLSDDRRIAMYIWDVMVHESGHRLHSQFRKQIDDVLSILFDSKPGAYNVSKERYLWQRQVSEYATTNRKEFLAESFTRYMHGDHVRIYPPLLDLFKQLDRADDFGIFNISKVFKEFKP